MTRDRRIMCVESINACISQKPYVNLHGARREAEALHHLNPTSEQKAALDNLINTLSRILNAMGNDLTRDDLSNYWPEVWSAKEAVVERYVDETGCLHPWLK